MRKNSGNLGMEEDENEINLKYDKLKNLMDVNNYTFEKIVEVIKNFKNYFVFFYKITQLLKK